MERSRPLDIRHDLTAEHLPQTRGRIEIEMEIRNLGIAGVGFAGPVELLEVVDHGRIAGAQHCVGHGVLPWSLVRWSGPLIAT